MTVSILLPSLNFSALARRIQEIKFCEPELDYEIIVVSPFPVSGPRVVWVFDKEVQGAVKSHSLAFQHSTGDYLVAWSDEIVPTESCLSAIVDYTRQHLDPFVAGFMVADTLGNVIPPLGVYGKLYVGYSCFTRKTVGMAGGYYDTIYKGHWADPDFCLRVYQAGGSTEVCSKAFVTFLGFEGAADAFNESFFKEDLNTFLDRWHSVFGSSIPRNKVLQYGILNHVV